MEWVRDSWEWEGEWREEREEGWEERGEWEENREKEKEEKYPNMFSLFIPFHPLI